MTDEEMDRVQPVIEMAQRLHFKLHGMLIGKGVEPIDALIACLYATHNLASVVMGPVDAIEWMRNATDGIEHQLLTTAKLS